jgi:UDP-N-acetylmuramoylalanine--D-glutamate ligase
LESKKRIYLNEPTSKKIYTTLDLEHIAVKKLDSTIPIRAYGISLQNLTLVSYFAKDLGISDDIFTETAKSFKGLEHRMEFVAEVNGITFINDSKATNAEATINGLHQVDNIILLLGGYDKKDDLSILGKHLENVKYAVAYGANKEKFSFIDNIKFENDLKGAFRYAISKAQDGDVVLLSPASASYDQFNNYQERGKLFKEYVGELKK